MYLMFYVLEIERAELKNLYAFRTTLADERVRNKKSVHTEKCRNIRTLQNN